jgi:hypothetical protein
MLNEVKHPVLALGASVALLRMTLLEILVMKKTVLRDAKPDVNNLSSR